MLAAEIRSAAPVWELTAVNTAKHGERAHRAASERHRSATGRPTTFKFTGRRTVTVYPPARLTARYNARWQLSSTMYLELYTTSSKLVKATPTQGCAFCRSLRRPRRPFGKRNQRLLRSLNLNKFHLTATAPLGRPSGNIHSCRCARPFRGWDCRRRTIFFRCRAAIRSGPSP